MRYISLALVLILVVALAQIALPIPVAKAAEEIGSYYIKYRFEMDLGLGTGTMWYIINYNMTFYSDGTAKVCYTIEDGSQNIMDLLKNYGKLSTCTSINLDEVLSKGINSIRPQTQQTQQPSYDLSGLKLVYVGEGEYKGYPVYKFKVNATVEVSGFTVKVSGDYYIYKEMYLPLYINIKSEAMNYKTTVRLELIESNLPKEGASNHISTSKYNIFAGGLPGAKIVVSGKKGENTLKVKNEGTNIGYVAVVKKEQASLSTTPLTATTKNIIISVKPGEERTIELGEPLDEDVNVEAREAGGLGGNTWLLIGIVAAIIVVIVVALVFVLKKK